jgi:hypothetical protein
MLSSRLVLRSLLENRLQDPEFLGVQAFEQRVIAQDNRLGVGLGWKRFVEQLAFAPFHGQVVVFKLPIMRLELIWEPE